MPTLLSLSGLGDKIPASAQGRDLSGILKGESDEGPQAALYLRNVDGTKGSDGLVRDFFPQARGVKTSMHTMVVTIDRDYSLKDIDIFDDIADPYQMNDLYGTDPGLLDSLLKTLASKLKESDDVWYRENILDKIKTTNN